jgi:hypothetical protein
MLTLMGFGQTSLSGVRRGFNASSVKNKKQVSIKKNIFSLFFRLVFKIAVVFTFGLLLYQCMYNESNWQFLFDVDSETLIRNGKVTESEGGIIKVYWALNGMKQDDPVLIEFIKENVLVEPDNLPLKLANLKVNGLTKMGGQYGQPFEVEKILGLKSSKKDTQKGFFIEAGAAGNNMTLVLVMDFTCGK